LIPNSDVRVRPKFSSSACIVLAAGPRGDEVLVFRSNWRVKIVAASVIAKD